MIKRSLITILSLSVVLNSTAQLLSKSQLNNTITKKERKTNLSEQKITTPPREKRYAYKTVRVIDIGNSPNFLTVAYGAKTSLFAHPGINSVAMVFRNESAIANKNGTSGNYNYALSTDGVELLPVALYNG